MPIDGFLNQTLPSAVLIGLRIGALMSIAPFFGGEGLSMRSKAALTVALTVLLLPAHRPQTIPVTIGGWLQAVAGETMLGLAMALSMHLVFEAARLAGYIMGFQLGYSLVNIIDPQTSVDTPVMSVFTYTLALLLFLQFNVHHWMLRGLAHSYDVVAPGQAAVTLSSTTALLHGAAGMWSAAVQICAPLLVTALSIDVLLALLARASPQLPVLQVGMAVKAIAGFAVLWAAIGSWPHLFERYFAAALRLGERLQAMAH
jgi:flagellar biosynthetic protein FliR